MKLGNDTGKFIKELEWLKENEPKPENYCNNCNYTLKCKHIHLNCQLGFNRDYKDWLQKIKIARENLWRAQAWRNNPE